MQKGLWVPVSKVNMLKSPWGKERGVEGLNSQTTPGWWKRFPPSHPGGCSPVLWGATENTMCPWWGTLAETHLWGQHKQRGTSWGTTWTPSTQRGPARAAGNARVLTNTNTAAICPRYRGACKNLTLLFKMSIIVPVLGEGREARTLPFQLLSFHRVAGGGGSGGELLLLKTICRASTNAHPVKLGVLQEGLQCSQFIAAALVASSSTHYSVNIVFSLEKHLQ